MTNLTPLCPYCGEFSKATTGKEMYPHRPDLHDLKFFKCHPCNASVGTHLKNGKPLGTLANPQTKGLRSKVHKLFDPIWRTKKMRRNQAYTWLAEQMNIATKDCHIGMFDNAKCQQALEILKRGEL